MPPSKSAHPYRTAGAAARPRPCAGAPLAASIADAIFDRPTPLVEWTGDGVRADSWGRLQSVRHAMERPSLGTSPDEIAWVEVPKLLAIQSLRSPSLADLRAWLAAWGGREVRDETMASVLADARRNVLAGEEIMIGYEPRLGRTRIVWPWDAHTDIHDVAFMRAAWRSYFAVEAQPELKVQLVRWLL